jgi:hypothetical protein
MPAPTKPKRPSRWRSFGRWLTTPSGLAVLIAAVAVMIVIVTTGALQEPDHEAAPNLPQAIKQIVPTDGAYIQPTTEVGVDVGPFNSARLVIDGQDIPSDQITNQGGGRIFFLPGNLPCLQAEQQPGGQTATTLCTPTPKDIVRFTPGPHTISVIWWPAIKTETDGSSNFTWSFNVD